MTPDQHHTLYVTMATQYCTTWPRDALLAIGHSFALTYEVLPSAIYYTMAWDMPSDRIFAKAYPSQGQYRRDLLSTYPYLRDLAQWGADCVRPWQTVPCLVCDQPYQTRNPARWHCHERCRSKVIEEDASWLNVDDIGDVREYDDLSQIGVLVTPMQKAGKGRRHG